jgi:hypothetical protein
MSKEFIAAYKDGSEYVPFNGGSLTTARGEIDFADAYEEFIDAQTRNRHTKPVMLVRENGRAWRKLSASEMRRAAE